MEAIATRGSAPAARSLAAVRSQCQGNALHVFQLAQRSSPRVGFDASGVAWLDAYIEASRPHLATDLIDEFVCVMGSFYGECLIGAFGGVWALTEGAEPALWMDTYGYTYPLAAVHRQLTEAGTRSVAARYHAAVNFHSAVAA